jgi:hypothetical protein
VRFKEEEKKKKREKIGGAHFSLDKHKVMGLDLDQIQQSVNRAAWEVEKAYGHRTEVSERAGRLREDLSLLRSSLDLLLWEETGGKGRKPYYYPRPPKPKEQKKAEAEGG